MFTDKVLESIVSMDDDAFDAALEGLTDAEIDQLCEALEGLSSADKKSLKSFGKGIGTGNIKGSPEQDRNHEAVYTAAMNKVNSYEGADRVKALKALRKGVKKGVGGNIFTRGKRADAVINNMQQSANFHKEQDKTKELNNQLQQKINSMKPANNNTSTPSNESTEFDALESIISAMFEMDSESLNAAIESMSPEELNTINNYIDSVMDTDSVLESIYDALASMDEETLVATLESFSDEELDFIVANEAFGFGKRNTKAADKAIAKAMAQQKNPNARTDSVIDGAASVNNVLQSDVKTLAHNIRKLGVAGAIKRAAKPKDDPVAEIRDQRNAIATAVANANKRGEELRRIRTC